MYHYRIDGTLIDISLNRKIILSNSTVTVDIQPKKKSHSDADDPAVLLVSFEFKTGIKFCKLKTTYLLKHLLLLLL